MTFCSKINYIIKIILSKKFISQRTVADIAFHKLTTFAIDISCYRTQISCISQQVENYNLYILMLCQHIFDKVSTNKTGSTGNQISLHRPYYLNVKLYSASLNRGAFVSFSDKFTASISVIPQSTPIAGSSKRSPFSWLGI